MNLYNLGSMFQVLHYRLVVSVEISTKYIYIYSGKDKRNLERKSRESRISKLE